ncbi:MAG: hypothetical protein QM775_25650 [Pirellulales bacterium]
MTISTSPSGSLNKTDWFKGLRGTAITFVAGIAVSVLSDMYRMLQECGVSVEACQIDFGAYDYLIPAAIAVTGLAIEMIRRFTTNHNAR